VTEHPEKSQHARNPLAAVVIVGSQSIALSSPVVRPFPITIRPLTLGQKRRIISTGK
jgi:hypothetical protein